MTKIKIDIGKDAVEEAQSRGQFEEVPPGLYVARILAAEERQRDGADFSYINVQARAERKAKRNGETEPLPEGTNYGSIWDRISLSPKSIGFLTAFSLAMGMKPNKAGKITGSLELDGDKPGTIVNNLALVRIKSNGANQDGEYRAEVGGWYPYDTDDAGSEGFEPAEEPEDLDDEDAVEPEGEEEDFWTDESLRALEPAELSAAAREFDLDPAALKVKAKGGKTDVPKTIDAMVAAILEAQGVVDEEEGSDPEDPF